MPTEEESIELYDLTRGQEKGTVGADSAGGFILDPAKRLFQECHVALAVGSGLVVELVIGASMMRKSAEGSCSAR